MKQTNKKRWAIITAFLLVLVMCFPVLASADDTIGVSNGFKETIILSKADKERGYSFYLEQFPDNAKKVKGSSSKKSVAAVKVTGPRNFTVTPKKAGTTKVTLKGKKGKKTITCKGTIKVVKFQKPFKTLKINGKSYLGDIKSRVNTLSINADKPQVKLNLKAASGWKITSATVATELGKYQKLKSGKTYTIGDQGYMSVSIISYNKKNGVEIQSYLQIRKSQLPQGI